MEAQWISSAINVLDLSQEDILEQPVNKSEKLRASIKDVFLDVADPQWWWEHLIGEQWAQEVEDAWKYLPVICPNEKVWFIPLDEHGSAIYESTPNVISRVLGESPAFEYALVGKGLDWILIENHHNYLIGCGHVVTSKLAHEFGS
jgi:hypothetical protein